MSPAPGSVLIDECTCSICLGVLNNPVQTACGHLFCTKCLVKHTNPRCPMCRARFQPTQHVKDVNRSLSRILAQVRVACPLHRDIGCTWSGPLEEAKRHLDYECELVQVQCDDCQGVCTCVFLLFDGLTMYPHSRTCTHTDQKSRRRKRKKMFSYPHVVICDHCA